MQERTNALILRNFTPLAVALQAHPMRSRDLDSISLGPIQPYTSFVERGTASLSLDEV